jgi:excisionase family DNA binding protein
MSFDPSPQYLTVQQVADLLQVQPVTIYRWLKLPEPIPSHQVTPRGRRLFDRGEVQQWVRFRCTSPTPGQVA